MLNSAKEKMPEGYNGEGHGQVVKGVQESADPMDKIEELKAQIRALEKQYARGTRDNIEPPKDIRLDLVAKIERALRSNIYTTEELAKAIGEPTDKVRTKIKDIRKNLADVGTPDRAKWLWRLGDDCSAKDLKDTVQRLITGVKRTTAELTTITGARMSRVNGVLVELQRATKRVNGEVVPAHAIYNAGTDYRAEWLIMPERARPANLPPKAPKK